MPTNKAQIKSRILEAIRNGQVKMRPKSHFILRTALAVVGIIMLVLAILYLMSLIIFVSRQNGAWFAPAFGYRGWFEFFVSLPWILVALSLIFIVILELLVRHYSFAYRRPLLYSVAGIVLAVFLGGFLVARTTLHSRMLRYSEKNRIPAIRIFYRLFGLRRLHNVHVGDIVKIVKDGFIVKEQDGGLLQVIVTSETKFPLETKFTEGDEIVIFGEEDASIVRALGVRKVDDQFDSNIMGRGR